MVLFALWFLFPEICRNPYSCRRLSKNVSVRARDGWVYWTRIHFVLLGGRETRVKEVGHGRRIFSGGGVPGTGVVARGRPKGSGWWRVVSGERRARVVIRGSWFFDVAPPAAALRPPAGRKGVVPNVFPGLTTGATVCRRSAAGRTWCERWW